MTMPETIYFAIGPFCWGKAKTVAQAKRNCLKNLPNFGRKPTQPPRLTVWQLSGERTADAYVNDMGAVYYYPPDKLTKLLEGE